MAGGVASSNATRSRKRVEAESAPASSSALKRAKDGSAFAKCEECNKDVPVALISFHNCSLDAKIKMNLETQVVEMSGEPKKKPAAVERKKNKQTEPKPRKEKKGKNPSGRKRPPTAFFVFMEDFRKTFKESNPDCKSVATVAKEGGEKWKSLSDEEKKVYVDRAAERKAEYEKALESDQAENEPDEEESSKKEAKEEKEPENQGKEEAKVDDIEDEEAKVDDIEDEE